MTDEKPGEPAGAQRYQQCREEFEEKGFLGPFHLLSAEECREVLRAGRTRSAPAVWSKGHAVSSSALYRLATRSDLVDRVEALLGEDIMLWGASLVRKAPGKIHPWHTDQETSAAKVGRAVTVWIGIENTGPLSSPQLVSYSHRFDESLQFVAFEAGKRRGEASAQDVQKWAQHRDPRSRVETIDMCDSDALMFDGRLWHASHNTSPAGRRTALLHVAAESKMFGLAPVVEKLSHATDPMLAETALAARARLAKARSEQDSG